MLFISCLVYPSVGFANEYRIQGKLFFDDNSSTEVSVNNISVKTYRIGHEEVKEAEIKKDGRGLVSFTIDVEDIEKNDQIIVLSEVLTDDSMFGGLSTVITEKELSSGVVGSLTIYLDEIPRPVYEGVNESEMKICWKGMDDFSVVGYEVLRSEILANDYETVGRAGQTVGRQVCFTDTTLDESIKYYYKLGILTSWNAGEGNEVMISEVYSAPSDGLMLEKGIVEVTKVEDKIMGETDNTSVIVLDTSVEIPENTFDKVLNYLKEEVDSRGWSYQMVLLIVIGVILLFVLAFFIMSVELSNIRSGGSGVWDRKVSKSIFTDEETKSKKKKK